MLSGSHHKVKANLQSGLNCCKNNLDKLQYKYNNELLKFYNKSQSFSFREYVINSKNIF